VSLDHPQLFKTQLRAILRASHYGKIRLLIPMIAHAHEVTQSLAAIAQLVPPDMPGAVVRPFRRP